MSYYILLNGNFKIFYYSVWSNAKLEWNYDSFYSWNNLDTFSISLSFSQARRTSYVQLGLPMTSPTTVEPTENVVFFFVDCSRRV